jgi:hypothetical protein
MTQAEQYEEKTGELTGMESQCSIGVAKYVKHLEAKADRCDELEKKQAITSKIAHEIETEATKALEVVEQIIKQRDEYKAMALKFAKERLQSE